MPIDARISMGLRPQTYDAFAAYDTGRQNEQTFRTNQMAQQAAQATAARNAMIQQRAASVDFGDPNSVNEFARLGPETTPFIEAAGAGDTLFNTRAAERRSQGEFDIKQDEAYMAQLPRFAAQLLGDASPARRAAVRQMAIDSGFPVAQYDALDTQLAGLDPAAQQQTLQSFLLTTPGGKAVVEARYGPRTNVNTGATQEARNFDPLALDPVTGEKVPVTGPIRNTPDPRAPTIFSSSQGVGHIADDGSFTPVTGPGGARVIPYQAPSQTDTADADARAAAAEGLQATLNDMLGYYENLDAAGGIVSTERSAMENVAASAGASLPGRVLGRTFGSNEQTERDNIQTAIPIVVASLKNLTGMSAQQMNSNVELQLFLGTVGNPSQSIQTVREAFRRFGAYVASQAARAGGGSTAGGGGAQVAFDAQGNRFVVRNDQWVRE